MNRVICEGVRHGIRIRVILDRDGYVVTGFPFQSGLLIVVRNAHAPETIILHEVLSTIRPALSEAEYSDIADFIAAGEPGLATDTIFYAISEDQIEVDDPTLAKLSSLRGFYNTFDDADPAIVERVLNRELRAR